MKLRYTILKMIIDLLILCAGLFFMYTSTRPGEEISWLQADGLWVLIIVFGVYFLIIIVVELLLVYMRQDTWVAKSIKSLVAILLVITLFPPVLFGVLWLFGFAIEAEVVPVLLVIAIIRSIVGIWLGRIFNRRSGPTV